MNYKIRAFFALTIVVLAFSVCGCGNKEDNLIMPIIESVPEEKNPVDTSQVFEEMGVAGIDSGALSQSEVKQNALELINLTAIQVQEADSNDDEYSNFAIADVDNYVNVRSAANTDSEIVGRMYDGAVAQIQDEVECEDGKWLNVISGSLKGYIKAEYFIYGQDAVDVIDDYTDRYAVVKADLLNIRENRDVSAKRIGYALTDEKLKLVDKDLSGEWLQVNYADGKTGFVSAEYVTIVEEFIYAKTMEEIRAEEEAEKARIARQKEDEKKKPENVQIVKQNTTPETTATFSSSGNLRADIVNFALQYVGYPYVHGGNSLETGTDCSGFTSLIYAKFGYGLSRTPGGQMSGNGRSISLDQAQPGDIICYGKGKCTHVAIYMGNGQIVHAANSRKGVVVYNVGYDNILAIKNVID